MTMKKITFEDETGRKRVIVIPEWAEERNLYIMAGIEKLTEYNRVADELTVKVIRCNRCGECCKIDKGGIYDRYGYRGEDGYCKYLTRYPDGTTECTAACMKPFVCAQGTPESVSECVIKFEEVK